MRYIIFVIDDRGPEPEAVRPGDTADPVSRGALSELAGAIVDALGEPPIEP